MTAKKELLYVGFYLSSGTDESRMDKALLDLVHRGCKVQLVLLDGTLDNGLLEILEQHIGIATNTLAGRLNNAYWHFQDLKAKMSIDGQQRFILKRHSAIITSSVFFVDWGEKNGRLLIDSKIPGAGREKSFGMEFIGNPVDGTLAMEWAQSFMWIIEASYI